MSNEFVLLVCGFGRCGSSLVMQMLDAGGYPVTGTRPAYEDDVALLENRSHASRWRSYAGRAVKLLDPHIGKIPRDIPFRALWLDRDRKEQAKSQAKFAEWSMGLHIDRDGRRKLAASYAADRPLALQALARAGVTVSGLLTFEGLLSRPLEAAIVIRAATGADLDVQAMAAKVQRRGSRCYPVMLEDSLLREAANA